MFIAIQNRVISEYLREEHLAEFCSDFLETLVNTYDGAAFTSNVLK
jgi:hypothetical protein